MKKMFKSMFLVLIFGCFFVLCQNAKEVYAAEYENTSGEIKNTYNNIDVFSFKYDYITIFSEQGGFYNGEDVLDGKSLREEKFYSGTSMEIKLAHENKWFKSDSTTIYKYSSTRKDFDAKYKVFSSKDDSKEIESYVLDEEGLYKISYVFDGEVRNSEYYLYINPNMQKASVRGKAEYNNISVFSYFSFDLTLKDGYSLKNNSYYYAFGVDDSDLSFKAFDPFKGDDGSQGDYELTKEIQVEISDDDMCNPGERKYLYVKIDRPDRKSVVIATPKSYDLSSHLGASVVLFDKYGRDATDVMYYKKGDVIKGELRFNSPVSFSRLEMSLDGMNFFDLQDGAVDLKYVSFQWKIENDLYFENEIVIRTKNDLNGEVIVKHNGNNVKLDIDKGFGYVVDSSSPTINIIGDSISDEPKKSYDVKFVVNDKNIGEVLYYIDKCTIVQGDACVDDFDENHENLITLSKEEIEENMDVNVLSHQILINEETLGKKIDGEKLILFVKVVDKSGNSKIDSKYGYKIDNVIVTGNVEEIFYEQESGVVKEFSISVPTKYNVESVVYRMSGMPEDEYVSCEVASAEDQDSKMFDCFAVGEYYFSALVEVVLYDAIGNEEQYFKEFKFGDLMDGVTTVNGHTANVYKDRFYDIEVVNINNVIYKNGDSVSLGADFQNDVKGILGFNKIPGFNSLGTYLIYYDGEEAKILFENVDEDFELPTNYELLKMIGDSDKYDSCTLKGESCEFNLYLNYKYTTLLNYYDVNQSRLVKLSFMDAGLRFDIEGFEHFSTIDVFSNYVDQEYKIYNSLNNEVDKKDVSVVREITFVDLLNNSSVVDSIDTSKLGAYKVVEKIEYGNMESYPLEYEIVVKDRKAPSIKLVGKETITIRKGQDIGEINDLVDIYDEFDKNLTLYYSWDKLFDSNTEGKYVLSIWTIDSSGNKSEVVTKTVIVDNTGAVITYVIAGSIALFVVLVIFIGIKVEIKKERNKS